MEKTLNYVENQLCQVLKEKKNKFNIIEESFDSDMPTKERLQMVSSYLYYRTIFETILKRNNEISFWNIWLDICCILNEEMNEEEKFLKFKEMTEKYLNNSSTSEVIYYLYIYFFIFIFFIFIFLYFFIFFIFYFFIFFIFFIFYFFIFLPFTINGSFCKTNSCKNLFSFCPKFLK